MKKYQTSIQKARVQVLDSRVRVLEICTTVVLKYEYNNFASYSLHYA